MNDNATPQPWLNYPLGNDGKVSPGLGQLRVHTCTQALLRVVTEGSGPGLGISS